MLIKLNYYESNFDYFDSHGPEIEIFTIQLICYIFILFIILIVSYLKLIEKQFIRKS